MLAVAVVAIFVALLVALGVALTRGTRLARRPPRVVDPRPEGFRYTFYGFIANLIAAAPTNMPKQSASTAVDRESSNDERG